LGDELDIVMAADISPDLALVAIGGPKKKVRVYRVADGSLAYQLSKHTNWITAIGFSPDGRLLATADRNGGALLWQAAAGHERADLRGHKGAITALDWRADSAMLATASEDGTVRLWNPGGNLIKAVKAHKSGVLSVRFARDGNWVTAGRDRKVKTWKSDGQAIADLGELTGMALMADFTHDGSKIIASDYAGEVRVIDTASKKQIATLAANPPLLARRLDEAEKVLLQTQQKIQASKRHLKTQLVALNQAKAAHEAHESKLAKAQDVLNLEQKQYDKLTNNQQKVATASQLEEQAEADLKTTIAKQQAAEKSVQAAEATLEQVAGETAGLPDLTKLAEQHKQSQAEAAAAQQQLQHAKQIKVKIVAQQARFAKALDQFAEAARQRQTKQQELATELRKIQTALSESQQQVELLESSQQDFLAAEALRKAYAESDEP